MAKHFWLKLNEHFFDSDSVAILESQPNGEKYVMLWLKLLLKCLSGKEADRIGMLRVNDKIPYTPEILSKVIRMDIDTIRVGLDLFKTIGLIEVKDDGTIFIEAVHELIGRESESAERVKLFREKKKQELEAEKNKSVTVTKCNNNIEKRREELEKRREELELEKELDNVAMQPQVFDFDVTTDTYPVGIPKSLDTKVNKPETLYQLLWQSFLSQNDDKFSDYGKEGTCNKKLIEKITNTRPDDIPLEIYARMCLEAFRYMIDYSQDKYFKSMPFLPSRLVSCFDQVRVKVVKEIDTEKFYRGEK